MAEPRTLDDIMAEMGDKFLAANATAILFASALLHGAPAGLSPEEMQAMARRFLASPWEAMPYRYWKGIAVAGPAQEARGVMQ